MKNEIFDINRSVVELISKIESETVMGPLSDGWRKTCASIDRQISEEIFRIAVVGTVKSGKSTFVNSLFHGDYLKRGAGVITSIVTKVRRGDTLKADLRFKSWEEVNREMENALALLPALDHHPGHDGFDIRNETERAGLLSAVEALDREMLMSGNGRDAGVSLMASYLKGYDKTKEILESGDPVRTHGAEDFEKHRDFVSDDTLAVYLRDLTLGINAGPLDRDLEIADCQGSDSPNPLHLVMVQDYLCSAHLIFYVISGRTGLREADIRFLSVIRKMGMADDILFVVNFDIDEHESETSLRPLIRKIRDELGLIRPDPELFVISALYNLFKTEPTISERDAMRLAQWEKGRDLTDLSDRETDRFHARFQDKLAREHGFLVIKSLISRLDTLSVGLNRRIAVNRDILDAGNADSQRILARIADHRKKIGRLESLVKTALDGALADIKRDLARDIDRMFDPKTGNIVTRTLTFVRDFHIPSEKMDGYLNHKRFSDRMDLAFREFRHSLDTHMAENITPDMMRFVRETEKKVRDGFEAVASTFESVLRDAASEYDQIFEEIGTPGFRASADPNEPRFQSTGMAPRTALPPVGDFMRYGAKVKTEAFMILGVSRVATFFKRLLKIQNRDKKGEIAAIQKGVVRMKRDTERALLFHFKDYKENMKYQHILKFAEQTAENYRISLMEQYMAFHADLSHLSEQTDHTDSKQRVIDEMGKTVSEILDRIQTAREKLESATAGGAFESTG